MAVWIVKAGGDGDEEPTALDNNVATIHWNEFSDLSGVSREDLENLYREAAPQDNNYQVAMAVRQVWDFLSEIKQGDLVIIPLWKMRRLAVAVGEVIGPYAYRKDLGKEVHHTLPVEWFIADLPRRRLDKELSDALDHPPTVYQIQTPSDAEERFRAVVRDEINRKWKRVFKNLPAVEANIVHKDGAHTVKLHSLPREGELLRLCSKGATLPLDVKVDYIVHNIGEVGHTHAVEVHVSESTGGQLTGLTVADSETDPDTGSESGTMASNLSERQEALTILPDLGSKVYDIRAGEQNWAGVGGDVTCKPRVGILAPSQPKVWFSIRLHVNNTNPSDLPADGLSLYDSGKKRIGDEGAWYLVSCTPAAAIRIVELSTHGPAGL